ncbi:hypothetical protein BH11PSE5_BH11PSE5_25060 [soil metagenome]|jgi:hypothetical protein|uniref:hypothetical protein n=1 Tax=unclassified Sphingobium TaxID=2611147 RepID=UPI001E28BDB8|nr:MULTISPECIES: hypothetical protein [unclassified Sphingobium]GLI96776.1 hypothetical protein Sbs19_05940 [Sphingobium sp. BS19]CAH0352247.1 hypothetical protein SPH9361_01974 [Sphingobium sp. CECT 9361]|tara:strand:+ start:1331 stop:1519 length:189 start_codon:yes stop_codon:yes gene_type:complete
MRAGFLLTIALPLALAACGEGASGDGVGGVSASEARALNQAAEMLDNRPASPAAQNATAATK